MTGRLWKLASISLLLVVVPISARAGAQSTICKDASTTDASGRGACSGHGGVDARATAAGKKASRASRGGPIKYKKVTCTDGSSSAGGRGACSGHAGIRSANATAAPAPMQPSTPTPARRSPPARASRPSAQAPSAPRSGNATAKCRDGSLSYSANRRGTCSHHGGVAQWNP